MIGVRLQDWTNSSTRLAYASRTIPSLIVNSWLPYGRFSSCLKHQLQYSMGNFRRRIQLTETISPNTVYWRLTQGWIHARLDGSMIARIEECVTGASGRVIMASINERATGFVHERMDRCMDTQKHTMMYWWMWMNRCTRTHQWNICPAHVNLNIRSDMVNGWSIYNPMNKGRTRMICRFV